jgi:hypothetical protein
LLIPVLVDPDDTSRGVDSSSPSSSASASARTSTSTTTPPQDSLLQVISTPDRGLAVVTTRKIKAGTLLLAERPLIALSKTEETDPQAIERDFAALSKAEQRLYLSLFDAQKSRMSRVVSIYYSNCYNCEEASTTTTATTTAIAAPNDERGTHRRGSAIGALSSRINHSCVPNVQFSYHEEKGEMRFFALRDIPRGREVCGSYEREVCLRAAERQRVQLMYYGFVCSCEACAPRTEFWARSDERRRAMHDALGRVKRGEKRLARSEKEKEKQQQQQEKKQQNTERTQIVVEALEALTRLEGLLLKEGLVGVPLANTYRGMAKWAERKGEMATQEVVKWKMRELDVCTTCFGEDARRTREIKARLDELRAE